ncbi:MAG: ATP-binding protein [Thermoplasmata archaeon]|nr:ATP-binding protein [Thermoplasmata archaeon]
MKISIASGKGGTGKTTIAVNMALSLDDAMLIDCDVEEPNCHLFFKEPMEKVRDVGIPVPEFDLDKCDRCGKCADFCQYNAIAVIKDKLLFFEELCHGCGGCKIICPLDVITEVEHFLGVIEKGGTDDMVLYHGLLNIGEPFGVPIIRTVKDLADDSKTVIFDSPPGTACPAVEAMNDSDYVILVTEPTPFGLHDLRLAVDVVIKIGTPFGVVVNRGGIGDDRVDRYCREEEIPLLATIPNDLDIARLYSKGIPIIKGMPEYKDVFAGIYDKIDEIIDGRGAY